MLSQLAIVHSSKCKEFDPDDLTKVAMRFLFIENIPIKAMWGGTSLYSAPGRLKQEDQE